MKTMKIGIIGNGTVGHATARVWMEHADVRIWDVVAKKKANLFRDTVQTDLVFVCIPEGGLDELFLEWVGRSFNHHNFVIKSTVPIGTTRKLKKKYDLTNVVHSPEFLTERCAVADAFAPSRNIIGNPDWGPMNDCGKLLSEIYRKRFPGVPLMVVRAEESELVKLAQNAFFATKISFFNEVKLLCDKVGANWHTVLAGVLADGRIAYSHTQVPGHDGKPGFGGKCLPKDLKMFDNEFALRNMVSHLASAVLECNQELRDERLD